MTELVAPARRSAAASSLLAAGGFAALGVVVVGAGPPTVLAAAIAGSFFVAAVAVKRPVISWTNVLMALLLVVLFIPIRRYRMPVDLPFQLEPYRVLVILIVGGWLASLLVDRRVRLRRSGLEGPVAAVMVTTVGSILVNGGRVSELQSTVLKSFTFLLSFGIVFYLVVSVVRRSSAVDTLAKTFVAGGAVVGLLAVLEARTGITPFTRLHELVPVLIPDPSFTSEIGRGGAMRAFGPAEHPIALGAALVLLVPLAVYVVRVSSPVWSLALVALVVGVLSTVSRTGILMLLAMALVFLWLRFRETRRLWPLLVPMLAEVSERPFLGYGFGTRITTGPDSNACILDNQWLGTLLEVGVIGALAWLWLFLSVLRRFGRRAKDDPSPTGWLLAAVTASVTAYAVGMFTYDALGFVQVTFLLFIVLGLGAAAAANQRRPSYLGP